jgi:hypothetical protein
MLAHLEMHYALHAIEIHPSRKAEYTSIVWHRYTSAGCQRLLEQQMGAKLSNGYLEPCDQYG